MVNIHPKVFNLLLILFSLFGYLEWGGNHQSFLGELEMELFAKFLVNPLAVLHPLTILPMLGQVLLIITLFQKTPSKLFTYSGIGMLGVLFLLLFAIGIMNLNWKIFFSPLPFIITALFTIYKLKKHK
jgi:hypothetical protein